MSVVSSITVVTTVSVVGVVVAVVAVNWSGLGVFLVRTNIGLTKVEKGGAKRVENGGAEMLLRSGNTGMIGCGRLAEELREAMRVELGRIQQEAKKKDLAQVPIRWPFMSRQLFRYMHTPTSLCCVRHSGGPSLRATTDKNRVVSIPEH